MIILETLLIVINYVMRVLPGIVLIGIIFVLIKPNSRLRIILYILFFVLLRDTMTPLELWLIGDAKGILWIRLSTNPIFLIIFGISSLTIMVSLFVIDKENRKYLLWFRNKKIIGLVFGVVGCIAISFPFLILYRSININQRGGIVSTSLLIPILIFTLLGNLFEEGLFRGYVLGLLKNKRKPIIAGIYSGIIFALCHMFLAITVTNIGIPLLVFTLWEGIISGIVGVKYGIIPATIAHGGTIFLLSSSLI